MAQYGPIVREPDLKFSRCINDRFFHGKRNGFFIECGANDGISKAICWYFGEELNWTGINVEPNPYAFKALQVNRPRDINEEIALSDHAGEMVMFIPLKGPRAEMPLQASLEDCRVKHWSSYGGDLKNKPVQKTMIPVDTYVNLIAKHKVKKLDLFVLDVEAHEMPVLKGMVGCPVLPTVLCIEDDKISVAEVCEILGPLGYTRQELGYGPNSFFVKDNKS